jgi:hypothetical protein
MAHFSFSIKQNNTFNPYIGVASFVSYINFFSEGKTMKEKQEPMDELSVHANREHKSSVFSMLFSKPDILRELYSAIEGINLPPDTPVNINTISGILIIGMRNDISFIIDNRLIVLIEHQSLSEKSDNDCYPSKNIIRVIFVNLYRI